MIWLTVIYMEFLYAEQTRICADEYNRTRQKKEHGDQSIGTGIISRRVIEVGQHIVE